MAKIMNDYHDQLTEARRLAHWSALERMRQGERAREAAKASDSYDALIGEWRVAMIAKRLRDERGQVRTDAAGRPGRLERSLLVLAVVAGAGALGAAIGAAVAVFSAMGGRL